ncbi:MAG: class I SAM-dependent methyltransferase [Deltaproteobacteria bacterium]|nr:MAG: class I SAM-dependent methyltransferase [Deltaproteobacteria bacterium]
MYKRKAIYFDHQVKEGWAAKKYTEPEKEKLEKMFIEAGPFNGLKILEPGCGTGRLTEMLADRVGLKGRVIALDISPEMVEAARARVAGRKNVEIHQAVLETFGIADASFDMVICHQVFPHFTNKAKALESMHRALKKGGKLIVHHLISLREINDLHRKAGTAVQDDIMPDSDEMKILFGRSGFTIVLIRDGKDGYFLSAVKTDDILEKQKIYPTFRLSL